MSTDIKIYRSKHYMARGEIKVSAPKLEKVLRRVIQLGNSRAVTLPPTWVNSEWVWIMRENDRVTITPAKVE